jgi:predicted ATPase
MLGELVPAGPDRPGPGRTGSGAASTGTAGAIRGAVPRSVHSVISSRLDTLPPAAKAVLQDAAVLGETFQAAAVAALSRLDGAEVSRCLGYLERREFLRRVRQESMAGDAEYAFRHVLVRDVAYSQLPRATQADKQRRAAAWGEGLPA